MNPRPKTIYPGFYILILNFDIGRRSPFRMGIFRYSLRNSTFKEQASVKAVLQL